MGRVLCSLEFRYANSDVAERVLRAVENENTPYVAAHVEGDTLFSQAEAETVESLVHTLEDYLACLSVAEKMLDLV